MTNELNFGYQLRIQKINFFHINILFCQYNIANLDLHSFVRNIFLCVIVSGVNF